jgi:HAUS augmin-like complex subunit 3
MSAKQLCDALAVAGFDGGEPLDPESLDWAFLQGDDSRRVLAWIAARLRPANVLSASDLELYIPYLSREPSRNFSDRS